MEQYEVITSLWFWAAMLGILALHICCAALPPKNRILPQVLAGMELFLHLLLFIAFLLKQASLQELLFALLLSAAAALLITGRKKGAAGAQETGSKEGEGKDGI